MTTSASVQMDARRTIPGTPIFDGPAAMQGYALNSMCFSFNDPANRKSFVENEEAYFDRFNLSDAQRVAVRNRDVLGMIAAGGNIYYLAKLAGIFGLSVQDVGAAQTGVTVDEFKAGLMSHQITLSHQQECVA